MSSSISHLRKRKIEDHNNHAPLKSSTMRKHTSQSQSQSSSSPSSSPDMVQFFVRINSKSRVLRFDSSTTVKSVIDRVHKLIGIPVTVGGEHRLIHGGRQLDAESTLAESGIQSNTCLELTAGLRSTQFPRAWQLVHDLEKAVTLRLNGKSVPKEIFSIENVVSEFMVTVPSSDGRFESEESTMEHLQIFIYGNGPANLVRLYLLGDASCRSVAERAISLFIGPAPEFLPKNMHNRCWVIVMELCKMIGSTMGKAHHLYVMGRTTLGLMLDSQRDSKYFKGHNMVVELFPFVKELCDIVVNGLCSDCMFMPYCGLSDFSKFLSVLKCAVKDKMGNDNIISKASLCNSEHRRYEAWVYSLHDLFKELLGKVDDCLMRIEAYMIDNVTVISESKWVLWSNTLVVLTNLHSVSKFYEGAPELLHYVLLNRRVSVNALIKRAKKNVKFKWILKYKDTTDYDSRQKLIMMLFPNGKDDYEHMFEMLIDRSQVLTESFAYIGGADGQTLHGGLFMEFKNEEATGPGVLREWFSLVCQAVFSPQNVLFLPCPTDRRRFFPNPASAVDPLHLKYYVFCGRVIALALLHKVHVGIVFDRTFFSQLAGEAITLEDVKDADPSLYTSCKKILEMDAELLDSDMLGLTFVHEIQELGSHKTVELCSGGKDIVVNSDNRTEYINLLIKHRFLDSISEQICHFAKGFSDVLSDSKFQKLFFSSLYLEDFDRMIGGSNCIINVSDWKAHTEYNGFKTRDKQINWFWKVVDGMSQEQRTSLLFFWTSVKYLPVNGFSGLESKLYIYKNTDSIERLPTSHTCFYRLCLPKYPTLTMMRDRLQFITQEHVSCSFGMW